MTAHPPPGQTPDGPTLSLPTFTVRFDDPCESCDVRALTTTDGLIATCQSCGHEEPTSGLVVFRPRARDRSPVVYYIRFGDRVKIGTTTDLQTRLTAIPYDEVLATEPGSYDLEKRRHVQLRASRIYANREWFWLSDEVREHIAGLA